MGGDLFSTTHLEGNRSFFASFKVEEILDEIEKDLDRRIINDGTSITQPSDYSCQIINIQAVTLID